MQKEEGKGEMLWAGAHFAGKMRFELSCEACLYGGGVDARVEKSITYEILVGLSVMKYQ